MKTIDRLLQDLQQNESFSQEVQSLANQPDALVDLLIRRGYHFSVEELNEALDSPSLSDESLEGVSGGLFNGNVTLKFLKDRLLRDQKEAENA